MSNQSLREAAQQALLAWNTVCGAQGWDPMHLMQFARLREALAQPDELKALREQLDALREVDQKEKEIAEKYGLDDRAQPVAHVAGDEIRRYLEWNPAISAFNLPVGTALYATPQPPAEHGCNCRWNGEEVLQRCELHQAWLDALSEWATRAKDAERRLREMASQKPAEQGAELSEGWRHVPTELTSKMVDAWQSAFNKQLRKRLNSRRKLKPYAGKLKSCEEVAYAAMLEAAPHPDEQSVELPPMNGTWYHGNQVVCCGQFRVFSVNFDTNPAEGKQAAILDWVCNTLNDAADRAARGGAA